ncbi:prepilin-type N-terminal cleavage/methylation domain-containing protein, partial [Candidatus Falkowbacteria bacterium]|nr:prepilin-type N-terminal cleavage/methylation domain-containing protein [Candidatus Falkowbacteria bacterium]
MSHFVKATRDKLQAFTLIELLVVIVIIGVLATLATVAVSSARGRARDAKRVSDLKQISTALEMYYADYFSYPNLITPGQALTSP